MHQYILGEKMEIPLKVSVLTLTSIVFFLAVASLLSTVVVASAPDENSTDTVTVSITISSESLIDVRPETVSWITGIATQNATGGSLTIENIGSVNVTKIWANVTQPGSDPFGGAAGGFNAGNMIGLRNTTSGAYYLVDRLEFNQSLPSYVTLPTDWNMSGRFRMDNEEFFFAVINGTGGNCTDGDIYISDTAHNQSQEGDIDLSDNTPTTLTSEGSWGFGEFDFDNGEGYCVGVNAGCTQAKILRWNMDADTSDTCSSGYKGYVYQGQLGPGQETNAYIAARVPYGVTAGSLTAGTLTILASTV